MVRARCARSCARGGAWLTALVGVGRGRRRLRAADFDARVEAAKQEEAERKRAKKARRDAGPGSDAEDPAADADPEMAALMGFGSFGGKK